MNIAEIHEGSHINTMLLSREYCINGTLKADEGNLKEALEKFDKAIKADPENSMAYFNRATIKTDLGDIEGARTDFYIFNELQKNTSLQLFREGVEFRHSGEYTRAIEMLTQAININPRFSMAFYLRALVYNDLGEYSLALNDLNTALRIEPLASGMYISRSLTKANLEDYQGAIMDLRKAYSIKELHDDNPNIKIF